MRAPAENIIEIELVKGNKGRKRAEKHEIVLSVLRYTFVSFEKEKVYLHCKGVYLSFAKLQMMQILLLICKGQYILMTIMRNNLIIDLERSDKFN